MSAVASWFIRVLAVLAAVFWAGVFYGLIDLSVPMSQDERFYDGYLLETGWGLLFTVLVAVPCVLWAVHPGAAVFPRQLIAIAVVIAAVGLAASAGGQVRISCILALAAVVTAAPSGLLLKRSLRRHHHSQEWRARLVPIALVTAAAAGGIAYAAVMLGAYRTGDPRDEITMGLSHLPMQAALGVSVAAAACLAVLAEAARLPCSRAAALPPAVAAAWLGALSVAYPDHLGSLGTVGGVLAMLWGLAFAAVMLSRRLASGA
jgi:hypothetical protein